MYRDEVLARSREENRDRDMVELEALQRAGAAAFRMGMLLCCAVAALQAAVTGRISYESWTIYFGMQTAVSCAKYRTLRRRHELLTALLYGALFLFFACLLVLRLMGRDPARG